MPGKDLSNPPVSWGTRSFVTAAINRVRGEVSPTPLMKCRTLDNIAGRSIFLKCENFQKTGSFKYRGALNAVMAAAEDGRPVATHSSGNFASALAAAARSRRLGCHVVMPHAAPAAKVSATAAHGAVIHRCDNSNDARALAAAEVAVQEGATLIHPSDSPAVIAGHASLLAELLSEVPDLEAVVVPCGGGGLLSGVALAVAALAPRIRVIGAEPAGADDAIRSVECGERLPQPHPVTIADGLRTSLGENTWPIVRDLVDGWIRVAEDEIARSMYLLMTRAKLVVEPSGAVALAAVLSSDAAEVLKGVTKVAVVVSGGNVDLERVSEIVQMACVSPDGI